MSTMEITNPTAIKSDAERKQLLARTIQTQVVQGARVESQNDFSAVLVKGHRPNHAMHAVISLLTVGIWLMGWALVAGLGGEKRTIATVDEYGNVSVQQV
jgi:hypothetical protein